MKELKLLSWNVNGIRAVEKKGFSEWLKKENPDILCLQETKAQPGQLSNNLVEPIGFTAYWNYPEEIKGYSGVALFSKQKPLDIHYGFGIKEYDIDKLIIIETPFNTDVYKIAHELGVKVFVIPMADAALLWGA